MCIKTDGESRSNISRTNVLWLKHQAVADIIFFSAVDSLPGAWKIFGCFACYQFFPHEICPWPWAV